MIREAGFIKTTLINYPGKVAAAIFLPGCNLRCPYCHNPELVLNHGEDMEDMESILRYLEKRKELLQGVCISGGEPLVHDDICELAERIKAMGYALKLDTNGTFPDRILSVKPDYIAMDIKTAPEKYSLLLGNSDPSLAEKIIESADIIKKSGIHHEFRTTLAPGIVGADDIKKICDIIKGTELYVLAGYVPGHTLDPDFTQFPYTAEQYDKMAEIVRNAEIPLKMRNN
ncbi:MAG: anaerobic ribonucleoside-triphosphate reductase activating protein [Spirochaetia bacterium]|nr:anaerobic ribonucleoside-triphosphate reductase activating protein [Spirochaetia bacterium]